MDLYHYDPITGVLDAITDADPDPLVDGAWLVPAFSTIDEPPSAPAGHVPVRRDGEWQIVEDHRGQIGYTADGQAVEVTALGSLPPPVVTFEPPPSAEHVWADGAWQADIDAMRARKLRELDAARDAAIVGGFEFAGVMYDSDPKSIQRINGAVTLSLLNPAFETDWITFDNSLVRLNAAQLAGLGAAAGQHEATQIFKARQLKDQALAATTREQLAAITW